jgi:hypothetical protein
MLPEYSYSKVKKNSFQEKMLKKISQNFPSAGVVVTSVVLLHSEILFN